MAKYRLNRKAARARKSMKMGADDLQEMVKAAVKEALEEQKANEGDEGGGDPSGEEEPDLGEILDAAVSAVNEKRKAAKTEELNPDDTAELVAAILESADAGDGEGKAEEEGTDLEAVVKAACESVNEKRKSADMDPIGDDVVEELLDAVAEVMADDEADPEGKSQKAAQSIPKRQRKASSAAAFRGQKQVQRKYSNIYLRGGNGEGMGIEKKKKEVPPQIVFARAVKCLDVFGRQDPERAAYFAKKKYM